MRLVCPNCKQDCETEQELAVGQHVLCPFCDMKFSYRPKPTRISLPENRKAQRGETKSLKEIWNKLTCIQKWMAVGVGAVIFMTVFCFGSKSGLRKGSQENRLKNAITKIEKFKREQYLKKKAWYEHQLDYNDLNELVFTYTKDVAYLDLSSMDGREVKITYLPEPGLLEYSPSIVKGYAQELIFARMFIENFEHPEGLKEKENAANKTVPDVINAPYDDAITIESGRTVTVKSTVSGEATVERGAILKIVGTSTGKILVKEGGKLELGGTASGHVVNKGTAIVYGKIAGSFDNYGRLQILGTVSGKVKNYPEGKCEDKDADVIGTGEIIYER